MALFGKKNEAVSTIRVNYNGKEAEKGLSKLRGTIKTVITAAIIKQVGQYTLELSNLGAKAELVERNFANFAKRNGQTVEGMTSQLRKASLGMVSDMELQQRAMQAMIAGVGFDDIITSMEFVTKFATATGADVSQKMQTTFTGLARGSAQFLDDIGIQVIGSKDVVNDAVAQMKEKMDQFTTSTEDAAIQAGEIQAAFKNLQVEIGRALLPTFEKLLPIVKDVVDGIADVVSGGENKRLKQINDIENGLVGVDNQIRELQKNTDFLNAEIEKNIGSTNKWVQGSIKRSREMIANNDREISQLRERRKELIEEEKERRKNFFSEQERIEAERKKREAEEAAKKNKKKKKKEVLEEDPIFAGFRAGLEERERLQKEAEQDFLDNEEELVKKRLLINRELAIALHGEDKVAYQERLSELQSYYEAGIVSQEEYNALVIEANKELNKEIAREDQKAQMQRLDQAQQGLLVFETITNAVMQVSDERTRKEIENLEKSGKSRAEIEKQREKLEEESREKRRRFARVQQGIAIAEATVSALKMGVGAGADTPGGAITRGLAVAAAITTGLAQVATIEAQQFQMGRIGDIKRSRQSDNIPALLGEGETVISAPQTAMHQETLQAIQNNTANTRRMGTGSGSVVNNYYGASLEEMNQLQIDIDRRNQIGLKI